MSLWVPGKGDLWGSFIDVEPGKGVGLVLIIHLCRTWGGGLVGLWINAVNKKSCGFLFLLFILKLLFYSFLLLCYHYFILFYLFIFLLTKNFGWETNTPLCRYQNDWTGRGKGKFEHVLFLNKRGKGWDKLMKNFTLRR